MVGGLFYRELLPFAAMIVLEFGNVVVNTLFKAATMKGMSYYVFIVYSYAIPAFILLPFPFFFRRSLLPPLNSRIIGKCFILGAIGMYQLGRLCPLSVIINHRVFLRDPLAAYLFNCIAWCSVTQDSEGI